MAIETVTGPIDPSDLGVTLPHEHLLIDCRSSVIQPPSEKNTDIRDAPITLHNYRRMVRSVFYPKDLLVMDEEGVAADEVMFFKKAGGSTIVDLTLEGIGRQPRTLKRISEMTGVHIIMGTGFYVQPSHPPHVKPATIDELAEGMIRELQVGVAETGVKAGIIGEIAVSAGAMHFDEEKVLRAGAKAQVRTKKPMNVHTWGDPPEKRTQERVLDILEEEGVKLEKVALSHVEQIKAPGKVAFTDWEYVSRLAERGAYVLIDTFGQEWPWGFDWAYETKNVVYMPCLTDFERVRGVITLMEKGYGHKILMSHDVWHKLRLKRYGGDGFDHLLTNITRIFKFLGVEDKTIHQLIVENPREYLQ